MLIQWFSKIRLLYVGFVVREDANGKRYYDHELSLDYGDLAKSGLRDHNTAPISPKSTQGDTRPTEFGATAFCTYWAL